MSSSIWSHARLAGRLSVVLAVSACASPSDPPAGEFHRGTITEVSVRLGERPWDASTAAVLQLETADSCGVEFTLDHDAVVWSRGQEGSVWDLAPGLVVGVWSIEGISTGCPGAGRAASVEILREAQSKQERH